MFSSYFQAVYRAMLAIRVVVLKTRVLVSRRLEASQDLVFLKVLVFISVLGSQNFGLALGLELQRLGVGLGLKKACCDNTSGYCIN